MRPLPDQLPGLLRIVLHANAPHQFFGRNDSDALRKPLGRPCNRRVAADSAIAGRVILRHILGVFVGSRSTPEP